MLQTIPDIGTLTIWIDRPLNHDKYHKYCLGRRIIVRFDSLPGDRPLLVINQTHLSGDNLQVTVYEVMMLSCICICPMVTNVTGFRNLTKDSINGCGFSNEAHCELLRKKSKVMLC